MTTDGGTAGSPDGSTITEAAATFPLGKLLITPGAAEVFARQGRLPYDLLARHASRDWGDLDEGDRQANDYGADHGERLLSAYTLEGATRIWIITESDRSITTILLPDEY